MDPPHHRQYRHLVSSTFSSRALASLSERISLFTQDVLARVQPTGRMDLIADLASPLAATIIADLLGLPTADHPRFKHWADALFAQGASDEALFNAQGQGTAGDFPSANVALEEMQAYFTHLLSTRRHQPRKDLLSTLLAASVEGQPLSQQALVNFCTLLLLAGHGTTTALLGQAILCLEAHPTALRQLRARPHLFPKAIEEVLRFASPVWRVLRVTRSAVVLAGVTLPADAIVFAWLASANRDERQFSHPESFDLRRHPNQHLAFGHGIHCCLGADQPPHRPLCAPARQNTPENRQRQMQGPDRDGPSSGTLSPTASSPAASSIRGASAVWAWGTRGQSRAHGVSWLNVGSWLKGVSWLI